MEKLEIIHNGKNEHISTSNVHFEQFIQKKKKKKEPFWRNGGKMSRQKGRKKVAKRSQKGRKKVAKAPRTSRKRAANEPRTSRERAANESH
ncbi:hypothetical protein POVWA1_034940 [Plasmodium ovale wallikeri]|uniref:Uncharacterized protein n=1 Tax=Plasmodium ovale wallikeri TaxID=864142 RepID=A0A1A8YZD9_PLAOA|nr:hypothetical protein POVWA1_034940 [Plasmodium ovale wallikeri]